MKQTFKALSWDFSIIPGGLVKFIFFILFYTSFSVPSYGQTKNFEGIWVLENIELYKYSNNGSDSTKVDTKNMPTNYISGAFDTISINGDKFSVNIIDNITKRQTYLESNYQVDNNIITLTMMTEFSKYSIHEKDDHSMILYRKFSHMYDNTNSLFGVKIKYIKK